MEQKHASFALPEQEQLGGLLSASLWSQRHLQTDCGEPQWMQHKGRPRTPCEVGIPHRASGPCAMRWRSRQSWEGGGEGAWWREGGGGGTGVVPARVDGVPIASSHGASTTALAREGGKMGLGAASFVGQDFLLRLGRPPYFAWQGSNGRIGVRRRRGRGGRAPRPARGRSKPTRRDEPRGLEVGTEMNEARGISFVATGEPRVSMSSQRYRVCKSIPCNADARGICLGLHRPNVRVSLTRTVCI